MEQFSTKQNSSKTQDLYQIEIKKIRQSKKNPDLLTLFTTITTQDGEALQSKITIKKENLNKFVQKKQLEVKDFKKPKLVEQDQRPKKEVSSSMAEKMTKIDGLPASEFYKKQLIKQIRKKETT